jgi:hypothetical protein
MKALSTTILKQRSETEQFFLDALEEVKTMKRIERKTESASGSTDLASRINKHLCSVGHVFPPIKQGREYFSDTRDFNISDMSWNDKEVVLRILFSKISGKS